jgi:hypothetical protein
VLFHHFSYFVSVLFKSVSFIFRIDSLATREIIIVVLFCLFSGFYCLLSYIYIYMDCATKLVLFGIGFNFARR